MYTEKLTLRPLLYVLLGLLAISTCVWPQTLLLDRGWHADASTAVRQIGWTKDDKAFVGDDFLVGREGETWVLDRIRLWATTPSESSTPANLGNYFEKITLFGALANDQATVECACHNLIAMKTAVLLPEGSSDSDVLISRSASPNIWQIDFQSLRWSVPGAVKVEFGIKAVGRLNAAGNGNFKWFYVVTPAEEDHRLRVFGNDGAMLSFLDRKARDSVISNAIGVQVWGHLLAKIKIQPAGNEYRVVLLGGKRFDVKSVDIASIRFGLDSASASSAPRYQDMDGDGIPDLIVTFPALKPATRAVPISACLKGLEADGVPFEGCDLLPPR